MRPWILAETNYAFVKENPYEAVVLPLGATEPHNLHLPYATDVFEGTILGEHICEAAWREGARVALLPTIPYGAEANMRGFPLALNLNPTTLNLVLRDLIDSLLDSGVKKIVLLNSHGGNELKPLLRELVCDSPAQVFLCNWYRMIADESAEIFDEADDHAGEMETSFALAYFADCVGRDEHGALLADAGATAETRFEAVNRGWVSISRPWRLLTTNSGAGDPHAATAEKGQRLMQALVERLAPFLVQLCREEIDEQFPF